MTTDHSETHDATDQSQAKVVWAQVNLFCRDVELCAQFFEALGLPRAFIFPKTGTPEKIEVDAGGVRIGFDSIEAANRIADLGVQSGGQRSAEVALWVDDVDTMYARALQAGATAHREPMIGSAGRLRYAWVLDPEEHLVKILQEVTDAPVETGADARR